MSIYDHRDKPAYGNFAAKPHYCKNPYILKWWTSAHDQLIAKQIEKEQWHWYWGITDEIVAITPSEIIETWKQEDPLCSQYAWYNVLMYFAASRAKHIGLTKHIRKPKWKICSLCNRKFVEDSLPVPLVKRLGIGHLDFCAPCLRDTVLQRSGNNSLSGKQVLSYLRDLTAVLRRVPTQFWGRYRRPSRLRFSRKIGCSPSTQKKTHCTPRQRVIWLMAQSTHRGGSLGRWHTKDKSGSTVSSQGRTCMLVVR